MDRDKKDKRHVKSRVVPFRLMGASMAMSKDASMAMSKELSHPEAGRSSV